MSIIAGSPLVGNRHYVGLQTCDLHGNAVVIYQGRACPYCLSLDELDQARYEIRDKEGRIDILETELEGPCQ